METNIELIVVGGARFLAWVVLLTISLCYYNIARLVDAPEFKIPSYGVAIESASWAVHQVGWWYWHLSRMSGVSAEELASVTHSADRIASVAYIGTAFGGVLILYPFLSRSFGKGWPLAGFCMMASVLSVGVIIAVMWTP